VKRQPPGHPAEQQNPEEDESGHVQQRVVSVHQPLLRNCGNDEKLKKRIVNNM
jgi:hypothetical protein